MKGNKGKSHGRRSRGGIKKTPSRLFNSEIEKYSGPVQVPSSMQGNMVTPVRLATNQTVSSDSVGVIFYTVNDDPSGYLDWSQFVPLYVSYRVLAIKMTYVPIDAGFSSSVIPNAQKPLIQWVNRGPSLILPTSVGAAWDNDGAKVRNCGRQFSTTLGMDGNPSCTWKQTAGPYQTQQIGVFGNGFTVSTAYGTLFTEALLQFRNRQ